MSQKNNLYLGKAGQLAVMSYFLVRGWNVATPEVDVGDDLFVIEDAKGIFYRVQVKTANATNRLNSYSAQFNVPIPQLQRKIDPEIYYVFVVCRNYQWSNKIVISRKDLFELHYESAIGTIADSSLLVYFSFETDKMTQKIKVTCSSVDVTEYCDNFTDFPVIQH
jgi:hypothetical protein